MLSGQTWPGHNGPGYSSASAGLRANAGADPPDAAEGSCPRRSEWQRADWRLSLIPSSRTTQDPANDLVLLNTAFEQAAVALALLDHGGGLQRLNSCFAELLQASAAELVGCSITALACPEDAAAQGVLLASALCSPGATVSRELSWISRDRGVVDVIVSLTAHADRTGRVSGVLAQAMPQVRGSIAGERYRLLAPKTGSLLAVIDENLDVSRLDAGSREIRRRPTRPVALLEDVLAMFQQPAANRGLSLRVETDLSGEDSVDLDTDRVRRVLLRLVGNALKCTEAGEVVVSAHWGEGDKVAFAVTDTGRGLDAAESKRLFERLPQRNGGTMRSRGEAGLGLAICRDLVNAMGGSIGVCSSPGGGSCFYFQLPFPPESSAEELELPGGCSGAIDGACILVVDDNDVNRKLVRLVLEPLGAALEEAGDGVEALERATARDFDVILMDIEMPRLDGRAALARLRQDEGPNRRTPVIAFSTGIGASEAGIFGFDGFVSKPVDLSALLVTLSTCLAKPIEPR